MLLIDNYVDESVLLMLNKRNAGVKADIYTQSVSRQLQLDLQKHNGQYPPIEVHTYKNGQSYPYTPSGYSPYFRWRVERCCRSGV